MDKKNAELYSSSTQKIRVITENWVNNNMFCPLCNEEYELKSKSTSIRNRINDGAYDTMIERIISINNPNFFFGTDV